MKKTNSKNRKMKRAKKRALHRKRYLKMVEGALRNEQGEKEWSLYILRCENGSLYTGIAKDYKARFAKHQSGNGAAYTRIYKPVALLYWETGFTRSEALKRELEIKLKPKAWKEQIISTFQGETHV